MSAQNLNLKDFKIRQSDFINVIKIISRVFVDQQKLAIVEMIVDFKVVIARGGREALELILL